MSETKGEIAIRGEKKNVENFIKNGLKVCKECKIKKVQDNEDFMEFIVKNKYDDNEFICNPHIKEMMTITIFNANLKAYKDIDGEYQLYSEMIRDDCFRMYPFYRLDRERIADIACFYKIDIRIDHRELDGLYEEFIEVSKKGELLFNRFDTAIFRRWGRVVIDCDKKGG